MADESIDSPIVPTLSMREIGYNGLSVVSGQVLEECDPNLRFPRCMLTYKKMLHDGTIAPAVDIFNTTIAGVEWDVKAPEGLEEEMVEEVKFLKQVMKDMEHSWLSFIKQATSYIHYGFAPFEIVPRYRLKEKGSRYNDGLVGIKKLALRSQDTISGFEYKNKGRDLSGVWQLVNIPTNKKDYQRAYITTGSSDNGKTEQLIPFEKLLLFRNNPLKNNPLGSSPFNAIFRSWKYRTAYEENEGHGVAADTHGIKLLYIPPQYMAPDADEADRAVYELYKKIMRNVHVGQESGVILPMFRDDIKGEKMFEFEIVNSTGQKAYDVDKIIRRLNKEILTALYADFLVMGQDGGGSFALSESKLSVVQIVIRSKLEEIRDVLNHYLVPRLFKWNKWETEEYPTFEFGEITEVSLDEFSKAWQRISATNGIAITADNLNAAAKKLNLPHRFDTDATPEDVRKVVGGGESRSGDGMETGMGSGVGKSDGSSGDSSSGNKENA
jgi:hypothetical protein